MSNLPDYTELTELRITNHQLRDRVATLEAALKTDVLKIAKVAIYQAMLDSDGKAADTIGCMGVELDDVKAENAKLKGRVELVSRYGEYLARYVAHGSPRKYWNEARQEHVLRDWAMIVTEDPLK